MLLGMPWKYERKVMHNGEKNTYTFWKDGLKVFLSPLEDEGKAENILSEREFVKETNGIGLCYTLIVKKRVGDDIPIPIEEGKILEEYVDVIPNEIPNGIPPKRDIQHHIDLILGSSLPNQVAYRMSPTQHP
jgi:hypothetical protein